MSKASARRLRRKAHTAHVQAIDGKRYAKWLAKHAPAIELPSAMVPVHTFKVQIREGDNFLCWQRFACMPASDGRVLLCTNPTARGPRSVGQWAFDTAQAAEAWAHQYFGFNGSAIRA